jgi:predicted alpha-1,6-mannanase (GH76 family)
MSRPHTIKLIFFLITGIIILSGFQKPKDNIHLSRAKSTLDLILKLYDAGHDNLLNETYPDRPDNKVTYLAGDDTITGKRVAYLWPTSGVYSAVNALYRSTGNKQYLFLIENKIIPGLNQYFDTIRKPSCYQSYIVPAGKSDRYYDDNIWLALDFCETYNLTKKPEYLNKSIGTWQFIISGWDEKLGGGIYWCEQKKQSKNTCSNAPASVLAFRLFEATRDSSFFKWGMKIYNWTKINLQDSTDHLYFDNKNLTGKISTRKYSYNSGQMLQATVILYKLTGNTVWLDEAQHIAQSAVNYFTEAFVTTEGKNIKLFKNTGTWFNSILFRGYMELYETDKNPVYISMFRDNMDQVWNHVRNNDGLFSKDWKGLKEDTYKALLDQSGMVEIWAGL